MKVNESFPGECYPNGWRIQERAGSSSSMVADDPCKAAGQNLSGAGAGSEGRGCHDESKAISARETGRPTPMLLAQVLASIF
jgi:hypothetical protein